MAEVLVKGELHSSRGDHKQEREILTEGVDHLILEGPEEEAKYSLTQQWYAFAMMLTEYLFFRIFYTDNSILEDIAEAQGASVVKTRKTDASVLENSHLLMRVFAAILFIILLFGSALAGVVGVHIAGVSLLILSVMFPILLLRIHESVRSSGDRNEKMAQRIVEAAQDGGRVVAIVGDDHVDPICDHLPEWIEPTRVDKEYPIFSWRHFKDIAYPTFVFISVLWVFYSLFIIYIGFAWSLG